MRPLCPVWTLSTLSSTNNIFTNTQLYHNNITALTLGLNYQGLILKSYNTIDFSVTQGLPILGADTSEANPSITNGATVFTKFNLLSSTIHYFTQNISIAVGTQAQLTHQSMLSSEQIGYGGQTFGQAFIPYVISGEQWPYGICGATL